MVGFVLRRIALVIPTFFGITLLTFVLIHLVPGDPIEVNSGQHGLPPALYAELQHRYGLDLPLWRQFLNYELDVLRGDLGSSITSHTPVWTEFTTLFPATVELSFCAMCLAIGLGLPLGIVAALRRGQKLDYGLMSLSVAGASMPIFWWGLMLILVFSVWLGWLPVSGRIADAYYVQPITGFMLIDSWFSDDAGAVRSAISHLVLPTIVLGTIPLAVVARITRSAMLEVLSEDYVRTARAKGVSPGRVIGIHALRNALIPVVTVIGLQTGSLLAGAILTETTFSWPGVGHWLIDAIGQRDYPVVQGGTLLIASLVMFVNLAVDFAYGALDPRIRR